MKPSFLGPNIYFSYFEIMAQFNDHKLFQIEQNLKHERGPTRSEAYFFNIHSSNMPQLEIQNNSLVCKLRHVEAGK